MYITKRPTGNKTEIISCSISGRKTILVVFLFLYYKYLNSWIIWKEAAMLCRHVSTVGQNLDQLRVQWSGEKKMWAGHQLILTWFVIPFPATWWFQILHTGPFWNGKFLASRLTGISPSKSRIFIPLKLKNVLRSSTSSQGRKGQSVIEIGRTTLGVNH